MTIIIALYNGASTLQRCLDSVKRQNYPYKELIVIDGASTDGSLDILRQNTKYIDYWVSEPDRGIYHAWNKGLERSTGDWINFLGADDYFTHPRVLEQVMERISKNGPDVRIVYGKEVIVSSTGDVLEITGEGWEQLQKRFLHYMCLPHAAVFHHRSLFDDHGRFDESFRIAGDYEFLLRELRTGKADFSPDIEVKAVTCFGISKGWDQNPATVWEFARAKRMHGIFPYGPQWLLLFAKALVKQSLLRSAGSKGTQFLVDWYRRLTGRPAIWQKM